MSDSAQSLSVLLFSSLVLAIISGILVNRIPDMKSRNRRIIFAICSLISITFTVGFVARNSEPSRLEQLSDEAASLSPRPSEAPSTATGGFASTDLSFRLFSRPSAGADDYLASAPLKANHRADFMLSFLNSSDRQMDNINFTINLPAEFSAIEGRSVLVDANHPEGLELAPGELFDENGVNAGSYTSNSNGYILFEVDVADREEPYPCPYDSTVYVVGHSSASARQTVNSIVKVDGSVCP